MVEFVQPSFCIPTVLGSEPHKRGGMRGVEGVNDLGECIGHDALACATTSKLQYPIKQGLVILV